MTIRIDRRSFLLTGSLGLGAFAVPGFAQIPSVASARGFTHAVARRAGERFDTAVDALCAGPR